MATTKTKAIPVDPDSGPDPLVVLEAIEPIRHDGQDIAPGGRLQATADQAEALVKSGAARPAEVAGE